MACAASLTAWDSWVLASDELAPDCEVSPDGGVVVPGEVDEPESSETSWRSDSSRVGANPTLSPKAVSTERSTGYDADPVPCT